MVKTKLLVNVPHPRGAEVDQELPALMLAAGDASGSVTDTRQVSAGCLKIRLPIPIDYCC